MQTPHLSSHVLDEADEEVCVSECVVQNMHSDTLFVNCYKSCLSKEEKLNYDSFIQWDGTLRGHSKPRVDHYIEFIRVSRRAAPSVRALLKGFLQGPE